MTYLIACLRAVAVGSGSAVGARVGGTAGDHPNMAARAYRDLETAGLVHPLRGRGVYVADPGSPLVAGTRRQIQEDTIDTMLVEASQLQLSVDDVVQLLRAQSDTVTE